MNKAKIEWSQKLPLKDLQALTESQVPSPTVPQTTIIFVFLSFEDGR